MNKLTAEKCREQFEAWASNDGTFPRTIEKRDGEYILLATQSQWTVWQASRAALEIALPILEQQERGEGEWIECSEKMPESGTSVLVWDEEVLVGESAGCATHYDLGIFWVHDKREGCCVKSYASHWQPLPAPPKPATNQNGEQ